ncbi:MAG: PIN domain-containing protein [Pseudomonadota bacterium]
MARVFFDTNTLLYLISSDPAKAARTEALLRQGDGVISVQVLAEFTNAALRRNAQTLAEIDIALAPIRATCLIASLTAETYDRALVLADRYRYAFYDSQILAAALLADCDVVYSEDMQHKQVIDRSLTILNPFR